MTLTQQFLDGLDREAPRTRRVLEQVPQGRDDWKPHDKSMPLARLHPGAHSRNLRAELLPPGSDQGPVRSRNLFR